MIDLRGTIVAKSDQLNADDLICGPVTIEISDVKVSNGEQPVSISYKGDNGKPYKPCKSMMRIMVQVWGHNGADYIGRRMTLYRDPEAQYGGMKVGGIRISHMSHMKSPVRLALTERRGMKKVFPVEPLAEEKPASSVDAKTIADLRVAAEEAAARGVEELKTWWGMISQAEQRAIKPFMDEIKAAASRLEAPEPEPQQGTEA